jgi:hypothetical protein
MVSPELQEREVRLRRTVETLEPPKRQNSAVQRLRPLQARSRLRAGVRLAAAIAVLAGFACSTLPEPKYKKYSFPEGSVFVDEKPTRPFKVIAPVRVRVNYSSMNPDREELELCRNYYNKGAGQLLKRAKREFRAEAVIDVRSVVYFMDGKSTRYKTPECADDGNEGQILMEGKAIRYLREKKKAERAE